MNNNFYTEVFSAIKKKNLVNQQKFSNFVSNHKGKIDKLFNKEGKIIINPSRMFGPDKGMTALMEACRNKNITALKILLKSGAKVNVRGYYNHTALHEACSSNFDEGVKILIWNGADVNARSRAVFTPLINATENANE